MVSCRTRRCRRKTSAAESLNTEPANGRSEWTRRKIEANQDKETFLEVVNRLQSERVVITHEVFAAIQATIDLTKEAIE